MSKHQKKASNPRINFRFNEVKVDSFKFDKKAKAPPEGKFDYHLGVASFFKKSDNEGIIKVTYRLRLNQVIVAEIITKNYFSILDLPKYLSEADEPINKDFEEFMEYLFFISVCHTRAIYCDRLEKEGSELKRYSIPFGTPDKMKT